jgi:putative tributyrin esterase
VLEKDTSYVFNLKGGNYMAVMEFHYHSRAMKTEVAVNIILPERPKSDPIPGIPEPGTYKTLYLLHGVGGNEHIWLRRSLIENYAAKYQLAVVMPGVGRTWYTDTCYGVNSFSFVAEELPKVCRGYFSGMSDRREDNLIAGLSMGGYGALKIAMTYPDRYFACASLSGALDITRKNGALNVPVWRSLFDLELSSGEDLTGTPHDLFTLTKKQKEAGKTLPKVYSWCGTEDSLLPMNREYRDLLAELGTEYLYEESQGNHTWPWWDLHIQDALAYLLK